MTAAACVPSWGAAVSGPRLIGDDTREECRAALVVAQATFDSTTFQLFDSLVVPELSGSHVVLAPEAIDISGGDALRQDPAVFERHETSADARERFFWQLQPDDNVRVVVEAQHQGWQGDVYALYAVPSSTGLQAWMARLAEINATDPRDARDEVVLENAWRPPVAFQTASNHRLWLVDLGHPAQVLGNWTVYVPEPTTLASPCTVAFLPTGVNDGLALLPPELRALDASLARALGSGESEGTLHPSARIRIDVTTHWGNVALRPWAIARNYNSPVQTDAALVKWAAEEPANARMLAQIRGRRAAAQKALAAWYERRFKLPRDAARSQAAWELDMAVAMSFVFPRNDESAPLPANPWPAR